MTRYTNPLIIIIIIIAVPSSAAERKFGVVVASSACAVRNAHCREPYAQWTSL